MNIDEEKAKKQGPAFASLCCTLVVNATMLVFFGIYAWANPDDSNDCYVDYDDNGALQAYPSALGGDSINVGQRFKIVFLCGFLLALTNLIYFVGGICIYLYQKFYMIKAMRFLIIIIGLFTLAWMAYASFVIFGDSGDLCRESYLPKSGQFIFVWLILLYCSMGIMVCCGCMFCCVVANNKKKKANKP